MHSARLTVTRTRVKAAAILSLLLCALSEGVAQRAGLGPGAESASFEVASVRPSERGLGFPVVQVRPGGSLVADNVPLRQLIAFAYALNLYESIEGDSDLLDKYFSVRANAGADVARAPIGRVGPLNVMMQRLLAERFELAVRWEGRSRQGFSIVRMANDSPLGPEIHRSDLVCTPSASGEFAGEPTEGCRPISIVNDDLRMVGHQMTDFARILSSLLGQPVIDKTGLAGWYEVRMRFDARGVAAAARLLPVPPQEGVSDAPSLFTAIREQLGLKLEPEPVTVRVLVVEHVEPPTPN